MEELGELLCALGAGENFADDEVKLAMKMLDSNGRGTVNLEEFTAWFTGGCPLPGRAASVLEAEEATGAMEAAAVEAAAVEAESLTREIVDTDA
jgi:hypothetical protein